MTGLDSVNVPTAVVNIIRIWFSDGIELLNSDTSE